MSEEELWQLIQKIQALLRKLSQLTEGSTEWILAIKNFRRSRGELFLKLQEIYRIPPNWVFQDFPFDEYREITQNTLIEAIEKIEEFELPLDSNSTYRSLRAWIKSKLRLRFKIYEQWKIINNTESLDKPLENDSGRSGNDKLTSPELLPEEQVELSYLKENFCKFVQYIEKDPEEKLRGCYLNKTKYPNCDARKVVKLILEGLFSEEYYKPSGKFDLIKIAEQLNTFGVPQKTFYQTFYTFWTTKFLPLIKEILVNF